MGNTCGCADKSDQEGEVRSDPKKLGYDEKNKYRDSKLKEAGSFTKESVL